MGGASSMDWWEEGFCERLMAGSRFVIRYDHRDTGRSLSYEVGAAPYSLRELAEDALGLLDALGLESAYLVGMSMGGWIGQLVTLENPDRVASLTLISTSPTAGPSDPDLPEMSQELQAFFAQEDSEPECSDREAVIDYIVEGEHQFAGSGPFEEAAIRQIAARVFDRTTNLASSITNHATIDSGDRWRERLGELSVPTLVIHGTEDPIYPYANAVALAKGDCWRPAARPGAGGPRSAPSGSVGRCCARHIGAHGVCTLSRVRRTAPGCHQEFGCPFIHSTSQRNSLKSLASLKTNALKPINRAKGAHLAAI